MLKIGDTAPLINRSNYDSSTVQISRNISPKRFLFSSYLPLHCTGFPLQVGLLAPGSKMHCLLSLPIRSYPSSHVKLHRDVYVRLQVPTIVPLAGTDSLSQLRTERNKPDHT